MLDKLTVAESWLSGPVNELLVSRHLEYSLGAALRNPTVKKQGPDLARREAKKHSEPRGNVSARRCNVTGTYMYSV